MEVWVCNICYSPFLRLCLAAAAEQGKGLGFDLKRIRNYSFANLAKPLRSLREIFIKIDLPWKIKPVN
jgi:hypothetical protein